MIIIILHEALCVYIIIASQYLYNKYRIKLKDEVGMAGPKST